MKCARCGKEFEPTGPRSKYCGTACRRETEMEKRREAGPAPIRPKKKRKQKSVEHKITISEIAKAAREAGMTYGEYVSKNGL